MYFFLGFVFINGVVFFLFVVQVRLVGKVRNFDLGLGGL